MAKFTVYTFSVWLHHFIKITNYFILLQWHTSPHSYLDSNIQRVDFKYPSSDVYLYHIYLSILKNSGYFMIYGWEHVKIFNWLLNYLP